MAGCTRQPSVEQVLAASRQQADAVELVIRNPLDSTLFPPDIIPCPFSWQDSATAADTWLVAFDFGDPAANLAFFSRRPEWTPEPKVWEQIKSRSRERQATVSILGFRRAAPTTILSRGGIRIGTASEPVGAPLFYREVNLPFKEAVKDPTRIRWRFGSIASPTPPRVVLEHLPVCGNCHSFSADGRVLGMDVDYANNKGSYIVTSVAQEMTLASSDVLTWDDYRREDQEPTFGLLSQVSPDGRAVISTVKDKSVFVPRPDLAFSQLFFPIKGILVVYRRDTRRFEALPGADDPAYVQSNPTWSPDGRYILFARAPVYRLRNPEAERKVVLSEEDCLEFVREGKEFQFDLYRVPYADGRGGQAEPLRGASANGRSNFFPRYSPDGQWIVFCQARSFMLLQPDSELWILPAEGGTARRLSCNTARMNSWHSWSPNSRWLVFSSKAQSPFTQLFLTHIDERGESTPPVLLAHFTAPDRAANIPEFVNAPADAIVRIREQFLNDYSHARAGYVLEVTGDLDQAIVEYQKALEINPRNVQAHQRLGFLLYHVKRQFDLGLAHTREALRLDPTDGCAHYDLGMALRHQGQLDSALSHLTEAVRLLPRGFDRRYNVPDLRCSLADAFLARGEVEKALPILTEVLGSETNHARAHYLTALALAAQRQPEAATHHYTLAKAQNPQIDTAPDLHWMLSLSYAERELWDPAIASGQRALELARAAGDTQLTARLAAQLEDFRRRAHAPQ